MPRQLKSAAGCQRARPHHVDDPGAMTPSGPNIPRRSAAGSGSVASLFHAKTRTGTPRRHLINIPARIACRARHQM